MTDTTKTPASIVHTSLCLHPAALASRLNRAADLAGQEAADSCTESETKAWKDRARAARDSASWIRDACGSDAYAAIIREPSRLHVAGIEAAKLQGLRLASPSS